MQVKIQVLSWNWGLTQSASAHSGTGASTGVADVKDLTFTKYVDKATPNCSTIALRVLLSTKLSLP